jgi:hypothetical protein
VTLAERTQGAFVASRLAKPDSRNSSEKYVLRMK